MRPVIQNKQIKQIKQNQKNTKINYDKRVSKPHQPLQKGDKVRYLNKNNEWQIEKITETSKAKGRDYKIINMESDILRRIRKYI